MRSNGFQSQCLSQLEAMRSPLWFGLWKTRKLRQKILKIGTWHNKSRSRILRVALWTTFLHTVSNQKNLVNFILQPSAQVGSSKCTLWKNRQWILKLSSNRRLSYFLAEICKRRPKWSQLAKNTSWFLLEATILKCMSIRLSVEISQRWQPSLGITLVCLAILNQ